MSLPYKALFIDLSGVLFEGRTAIPGSPEAIQKAREMGLTLRFVTNTATKNSQELIALLASMQIPVQTDELYTAPIAAREYLQAEQLRPYLVIHDNLQMEFASLHKNEPNCVVIGDAGDGFTYQALNKAFQLLRQGMPLIAIGKNRFFKTEQGIQLDSGAFVHALEWAAGTQATIFGKPTLPFFHQVVSSTPYKSEQCLMIGDDVQSDVQGAIDAGLGGCLVKTGKYHPNDEAQLCGDFILVDDLHQLLFERFG